MTDSAGSNVLGGASGSGVSEPTSSSPIPSRFIPSLTTISQHASTPTASNGGSGGALSSPPQPKACISTLAKMLGNILLEYESVGDDSSSNSSKKKPYNPKTRSVKLTNKVFHARVGSVEGGIAFLEVCGFKTSPTSGGGQLLKLSKEDENADLLREGQLALSIFVRNGMKVSAATDTNGHAPSIGSGVDDTDDDERDRLENEQKTKAKAEADADARAIERIAAEKAEADRVEQQRQERIAAEKAEADRIKQERLEKEHRERIAAEEAEAEAEVEAEVERLERERIAALEKAEVDRIEQERIAAVERAEADRVEQERIAATEKAAAEKACAEKEQLENATRDIAQISIGEDSAKIKTPHEASAATVDEKAGPGCNINEGGADDEDDADAALLAEIEAEMDSDGEDYDTVAVRGGCPPISLVNETSAAIESGKGGEGSTSELAEVGQTNMQPTSSSKIKSDFKDENPANGDKKKVEEVPHPQSKPLSKSSSIDRSIDIDSLINNCVESAAATPTDAPKRETSMQSLNGDKSVGSSGTLKISNLIEKQLMSSGSSYDSFDRAVAEAHGGAASGSDSFDRAVETAHGEFSSRPPTASGGGLTSNRSSTNDSIADLSVTSDAESVGNISRANESITWDDRSSMEQITSEPISGRRRTSEVLRDLSGEVDGGAGPASMARRRSMEKAHKSKEAMHDSFRMLERKFASCPLPSGISNSDSTLIRKGLRMCFAAFALASPSTPIEGLGDVVPEVLDDDDNSTISGAPRLKLHESEKNLDLPDFPPFDFSSSTGETKSASPTPHMQTSESISSDTNNADEPSLSNTKRVHTGLAEPVGDENKVPPEVANLIWAAVLGLEDGEEDDFLPSVSGSTAAIASSVLRYAIESLGAGAAGSEEQLDTVGDLFRGCLLSMGVLQLEETTGTRKSVTAVGVSRYRPQKLLSFPHDIHWRYGIYLASTEFGWPQGSSSSPGWTGDFVQKLFRRVALSQDYSEDVAGSLPDGNNTYGWYAARNLPHHMIQASQLDEVEKLLTDLAFVNFRMQTCGPVLGTTLHISDCNKLSHRLSSSSSDDDGNNTEEGNVAALDERGKKASYMAFKFASLYVHRIIRKLGNEGRDDQDGGVIEDDAGTVATVYSSSELPLVGAVGHSLHLLGVAFGEIHRPNDEIIHYEEALNLKKIALREDDGHESIADTLHCIGIHHQSQGEFFAAMSCYDKALRLYKNKNADGSLKMSRTLHNIAVIYCERSEFDVALTCFEQSLQIRLSRLGATDKSVADTQCWIGKVYREKGDYEAALEQFQKAFEAKEAILGPDHLDVAEALQNIGILYDDMEEYENSLDCYRRSLEIRRSQLGDRHEDVCEVLSCMANVYHAAGEIDKGLEFFSLALRLRDLNLKNVKLKKGSRELKSMLQSYEDVYVLTKAKLDEIDTGDREQYLEIKDKLAVLRLKQGNLCDRANEYTKTIKCYLKSLEIRKEMGDHKNMGNMLNLMGIAHAKRKHYRRAMKCFNDAVKLRKAVLPEDHLDIAETLHNIGHCFAKQGKIDRAVESYQESYDIKCRALGSDTLSAVKTLHCLGMLHEQDGEYEEAQKCYEKALDVRRATLGNDHLEVAYSLHSLAKIFKRQNDLQEAKECLKESLEIKRAKLPANHVSIAESLHQMALIHNENGKKEEALHCLRTALSACERNLGNHPLTAEVLESFSDVYESRGDYNNSLDFLNKALEMKELMYGEESLSRSDTLYAIGKIQEKMGDLDGTLLTFKEVMETRKTVSGINSLGVAAVLNDVGVVQLRRKEFEIALRCFEDSMEVWRAQLEDGHEFIGETLVNMGELNSAKMDFAAAVENYVEAIDIFKDKRGATDISVAYVYNKLGETLVRLEEYNNAVEAYQQCLSIRTLALGTESLQVASVNSELGSVHHILGQHEKAKECLEGSLRVMKDKVRVSDDRLADTQYTLGKVLMKLKRRDEAFAHFEEALKLRKKRYGDEDLLVANVLGEMGNIYDGRRDYEKALSCYNECLRVRQMHLGNCESVGDMFLKIGNIDQMLEDNESALENFSSALGIYKSVLGEESPGVAKVLNSLAVIYDAQNDLRTALKYYKEAHRLRKSNFGEDSMKVAGSLDSIAGIYQKQSQNDKALKCLKEALRIRTLKLGKEHVEVGTTLFGMGIVFSEMGDLDRAEECYNASLRIRKKGHGESSIEVAQTLHNLGSVHAMKEEYSEALQCWRNSLGMCREAGLADDHRMVATTLKNIEIAANYLEEQEQHF